MIKRNLGSKRGLKLRMDHVLRYSWRKVVVFKMSNLHVSLVARNINVSGYWVPRVAMVVVRKDTGCEIVQRLL